MLSLAIAPVILLLRLNIICLRSILPYHRGTKEGHVLRRVPEAPVPPAHRKASRLAFSRRRTSFRGWAFGCQSLQARGAFVTDASLLPLMASKDSEQCVPIQRSLASGEAIKSVPGRNGTHATAPKSRPRFGPGHGVLPGAARIDGGFARWMMVWFA